MPMKSRAEAYLRRSRPKSGHLATLVTARCQAAVTSPAVSSRTRGRSAPSSAHIVGGVGARACDLTWCKQKIFGCENFIVFGKVFERDRNFRDVVQSGVEAART
jgi:hypothetical protein